MISSDAVRARLAEHVTELGEGAWITLAREAVEEPDALAARIVESSPLGAETLRIGAREVLTPRRTAWHGDPGRVYAYSGRTFEPAPWTAPLVEIRDRVEALTGVRFDSVLVNEYRDGRDSMGWHSDDEPELGPHAPDDVLIASVSLGAHRRFLLRHRRRGETHELPLGHGDLLVMGGTTQRRWQHSVPKTAKPVGARVSLTFRLVRPRPA
ncbi:alpha-ketoglutarate-dependent dioxygenase AlkB family protein [Sandaracinus amylolyticus]|uniref:Alkylated DNA repair protein AlkB n=1 Tax=Sandaracinus amylolyticus TaxID=927083 RepID=A0A0F6YLS2_9BACT|nr:alpha-ketoglutarate-dependent dioxygenase AlkB [Sandaracinus amylolyticus]AKF10226.1 Alkylated DNA repair protein AlkB [Sandaracinus amylolyticus]